MISGSVAPISFAGGADDVDGKCLCLGLCAQLLARVGGAIFIF